MITKDEILTVANETGLTPQVVEKDYILGWLLAAIHATPALSESWVFKGGTCLKKCYFETYRFSEDLDFTLRDESHLDAAFLTEQFEQIAEWLYDASGIEIPTDRLVFDIYENPRGRTSCEARIYYASYFVGGKRNIPKVKVDLTGDEVMVLPASRQPVFHSYSDMPDEGIFINCYAYPELFGEKVRALRERGRPRDLYDVINLYRNDQLPPGPVVRDVLAQKCAYKGIDLPVLADMEPYKDSLRRNWEPMLAHQLPSLPSLEVYWDGLPAFFNWLEEKTEVETQVLAPVPGKEEVYRPLYGQLNLHTRSGGSLEVIRFAAGNRLCVELDYTNSSGDRSTRVIEPYSLREAANGNILLYAVRADDGQIRSYRTDQINDASVANRVFTPRYQVELSPTAGIPPARHRGRSEQSLGLPSKTQRSGRTNKRAGTGPIYIYRCPICDKTFRRRTQNPKLNPHKSKEGWPCPGQTGGYEDTR